MKSVLFGNGTIKSKWKCNKNWKWINCEILPNEISMEEEPLINNWKKNQNLQTKKLVSILFWSKHNSLNVPYFFLS